MGIKKKSKRAWPWIVSALLAATLLFGLVFWLTLPSVSWLKKKNPKETAMMGFRTEQAKEKGQRARRTWKRVPLSRISPYLIQAVLIAEDDKFFEHEGFDWESMRKALDANIKKKRILRGGSTITQQLAKNLFLTPEQSVWRKLREAAIAVKLEYALSKKRILELYLNLIDWGPGIYGAEAASRSNFNCPAAALTLCQAIRLASIIPNPHIFSALDTGNSRLNRKRRIIAARMLQRHWIQKEACDQALTEMGLAATKQAASFIQDTTPSTTPPAL
jgi:monofunctional biosynthetic peptidoglycan transglycosylase